MYTKSEISGAQISSNFLHKQWKHMNWVKMMEYIRTVSLVQDKDGILLLVKLIKNSLISILTADH
jgi:hypothetical protein